MAEETREAVKVGLLYHRKSWDEVRADVFGEDVSLPGAAGRTFDQAAVQYLGVAEGKKKPSTLAMDRKRVAAIREHAPWSGSDLATIDTPTLQTWIESMRADGNAPSTCNRYISIVSAVLEWSRRKGYVAANAAKGVERYGEAGREREVYLTDSRTSPRRKRAATS